VKRPRRLAGKVVEPFRGEAVLDERVVLGSQLLPLGPVDCEPEAAHAAEGVARQRRHTTKRILRQQPVGTRLLGTELPSRDVVGHRAAAEGEPAVPAARTARDLARLVQADREAGLGERQRARAARDAAADDLDLGGSRAGGARKRLRTLLEPVRRHAPIVLIGRSADRCRRWT
jgi:hypothetical protein